MIKRNTQNDHNFFIHFVTSYSILLIFILIMGLFLYQLGIKDAKNSLHKQNVTMLKNAVNDMDTSFEMISVLASQISTNTSLRNLADLSATDRDFYTYSTNVMHDLSRFLLIEASLPIDDYYVYLPRTNYLISSSMLTDARLFYQYSKHYNRDTYEDWLRDIASYDNIRKFESLCTYSNSAPSYLYKIPISSMEIGNNMLGMICFEISQSKLEALFSNLSLFEHGFLYVTDSSNIEAFRISGSSAQSTEYFHDFLINTDEIRQNGVYETTLDGDSVIVTSITSDNNGWHYYLVQPSYLVFQDLLSYQKAYSLIILGTILFSFAVIYLLSKRNVKPINQIKTALEDSIDKTDSLENELEAQRPVIYNSYLSRIMKGQIRSAEELKQIQQFLRLNEHCKYTVLYASVYQEQLESHLEEMDENTMFAASAPYRETIHSYFYTYFGNEIYILDADINAFALLLPCDMEENIPDYINRISDTFIAMHDELAEKENLWIFGGLGNRNKEIPFLWKSFQQASQACSYIREGQIFQSYHNLKKDKSTYYYPFEMAVQLSNFISSSNDKQIKEIFRLIRKENIDDRNLPINVLKWLLSDIRNTLIKVRFGISQSDDNKEALNKIDFTLENYRSLDILEEISLDLAALFEQKTDSNKLIVSIQTYINENYQDSSLSLKKISEVFNISESYFSYLFKAETKQNFSEYLELLRMNRAMHLVKTTTTNLSDLYLEVGYNNANSFRRAFKKIHGVAPKTIRDGLHA